MGNQIKVPVAGTLISFLVLGLLIGPIVGAILAVPSAVLAGVLIEELEENAPSLSGAEAGDTEQASSDESRGE